jgi:hypothetical protein
LVTTVRNLASNVERHLKPGLGDILVGDLTTAIVDEFYNDLRSGGRIDGKPLAVGTSLCARCHGGSAVEPYCSEQVHGAQSWGPARRMASDAVDELKHLRSQRALRR